MTDIQKHEIEQKIEDLKVQMKCKNRKGGWGASTGLNRMANELARLMERLNAS